MYNVLAYQIANTINVRQCKTQPFGKLLFSDSDELFFEVAEQQYLYIFRYGICCCFNMAFDKVELFFKTLKPFCNDYIGKTHSEDFLVEVKPHELNVQFNKVVLPELNTEMLRLVMLNAAQSVALDKYSVVVEDLLSQTNVHTKYLEYKGKLNISGQKLKRFIGKVLNIKNKIAENLYIFDSPDIAWEDEQLNKLNTALKNTFDLKDRYHLIHDKLEIVKENLELFKAIMDHRDSSRLEWIIIILILVEVVDMFILKFI